MRYPDGPRDPTREAGQPFPYVEYFSKCQFGPPRKRKMRHSLRSSTNQVLMRGPALRDAPARRVPERAHPLPDPVVTEHPLHLAAQLLLGHDAVRAGLQRQAGPPHVADVALVLEPVREVGPAQERHAVPHPLHRRVPPAVRHEARHRAVRQHLPASKQNRP
jgi:hypothetical protein